MVLLSSPEDVQKMFKASEFDPQRIALTSLKKIRLEHPENFFEQKTGILLENGEEWQRVRSKVQVPLLKPKSVAMYLPQMDDVAKSFVEMIKRTESAGTATFDNFSSLLRKFALESIALVCLNRQMGFFGKEEPDRFAAQFLENSQRMLDAAVKVELGIRTWKLYKTKVYRELEDVHNNHIKVFQEVVEEASMSLAEAKSSGDPNRSLTILEAYLNTEGLSKTDVSTMIIDLVFGGVDNVSTTLAFFLYALAKNPDCQEKLQEEIDRIVGSQDGVLTSEQINEMTYLYRSFKESMRMHNIAYATARNTLKDEVYHGYHIPEGTMMMVLNDCITMNEKYFERPTEFLPERWNRDRPLGQIHPYSSIPFSFGKRMCIGKRIAMQEMSAFIIRLLQQYTVTLDQNVQLEVKSDLLLKPAFELPFQFVRRQL